MTGLYGSGKRELAYTLEKALFDRGKTVVVFDGATVRAGLSHELEYTLADRAEHLRRVAHICKMLNDQGIITICAFISPSEIVRFQVKEIIRKKRFSLTYLDKTVDESRNSQPDLYLRFEDGEISNLPGMDLEYESPIEMIKVSDHHSVEDIIKLIVY